MLPLGVVVLLPAKKLVDEILVLVGLVVGGTLQGQRLVDGAPSLQGAGDL